MFSSKFKVSIFEISNFEFSNFEICCLWLKSNWVSKSFPGTQLYCSLPWFPLSGFLPKLWWTLPRLDPSQEDSPGPLLEAQVHLLQAATAHSVPTRAAGMRSSQSTIWTWNPWLTGSRRTPSPIVFIRLTKTAWGEVWLKSRTMRRCLQAGRWVVW